MDDLLKQISRCSNIESCIGGRNCNHPCSDIVQSQNIQCADEFRAPEPWSGNLGSAPILFISDSTITASEEEYPTLSWPDFLIKDFFNNRFGGGQKRWVKDGLYPLCKDSSYKKQWNRLWSSCINRTLELKDSINIMPGHDFAITEIARCRITKHFNTNSAANECSSLYLRSVISLSGASVIVGMGEAAKYYICKECGFQADGNIYGPISNNNQERYFAFLPHYHKRGNRAFNETMGIEELKVISDFLNSG